jgi:hypothetical protein
MWIWGLVLGYAGLLVLAALWAAVERTRVGRLWSARRRMISAKPLLMSRADVRGASSELQPFQQLAQRDRVSVRTESALAAEQFANAADPFAGANGKPADATLAAT